LEYAEFLPFLFKSEFRPTKQDTLWGRGLVKADFGLEHLISIASAICVPHRVCSGPRVQLHATRKDTRKRSTKYTKRDALCVGSCAKGDDFMRNLLAFAAALVLAFAGIGWYRGWYKVESEPTSPGHQSVNIDFNRDKIVEDGAQGVKKVEEKLQKVLNQKSDGAAADDQKANIKGAISLSPPQPGAKQEKNTTDSGGPILPD